MGGDELLFRRPKENKWRDRMTMVALCNLLTSQVFKVELSFLKRCHSCTHGTHTCSFMHLHMNQQEYELSNYSVLLRQYGC
jgi:hypothetical protein